MEQDPKQIEEQEQRQLSSGTIINNVYCLENQIGKGEFGTVYQGFNMKTNKQVAIKIEPSDSDMKILKHETTIINHLYKHGCRFIPCIYWYGLHNSLYTCLVMQHYVCSLHDYSLSKNISVSLLDNMMMKCIYILESIHNGWVIHRDIKPQNFMIGADKELYLIDFGMATFYVDEYKKPIHNTSTKQYIVGSPKYASYFIHCGMTPERRDDLISLGYMYMFLRHPGVSWDDFRASIGDGDHTDTTSNAPNSTIMTELDINHPRNIVRKNKKRLNHLVPEIQRIYYNEDSVSIIQYMEYCYRLQYTTTPLYSSLVSLFS